jgi:phosphate:Na+ symporter
MELMSGATRPLHGYPAFLALMRSMGNPLFGILAGTVMTALIHSSAATIGIVIVLASQGFVSIEAGIALVFGANIGTCATAVLAAVGRPREAVRAAVIHVLFKVLGIAIWYAFIDQLALLVQWLSPADPGLEGAARLAAETPRQIANAHTIFNVGNALIFVWLTDPLVRLVRFIVPDRPGRGPEAIQPKYLDDSLLGTPELALDRARMELRRLGACAVRMVREALNRVVHGDDEDLKALARMDNDVDALHAAIIAYLGRLSLRNLTKAQSARVYDLIAVANYTENIGDMIETNLVAAGQERLKLGVAVSKGTQDVLLALHEKVLWTVKRSLSAHAKSDFAVAVQVVAAKDDINRLAAEADSHLARRLVADEPNRLAAFRIESDLIENLRRVYYFAKRIAKMAAEATAAPSGAEALPFDDEGLAGYGSG